MSRDQVDSQRSMPQSKTEHQDEAEPLPAHPSASGPTVPTDYEGGNKPVPNTALGSHRGVPEGRVPVIVKVAKDGYIPPGLVVRSQISPQLFTAEVDRESLERLQDDADVLSVATPTPLRPA